MIKLLRRNRIEEELGKSVKIFGKTISVNVIYSKIKNPELDLVGNTNKVTVGPYYGIITYNIDQNLEIKAINLIIPASDMETYIEKIDIKSEVERFKTVQNDIQNEKTLITLKNEFNKSQIINKK